MAAALRLFQSFNTSVPFKRVHISNQNLWQPKSVRGLICFTTSICGTEGLLARGSKCLALQCSRFTLLMHLQQQLSKHVRPLCPCPPIGPHKIQRLYWAIQKEFRVLLLLSQGRICVALALVFHLLLFLSPSRLSAHILSVNLRGSTLPLWYDQLCLWQTCLSQSVGSCWLPSLFVL